MATKNISRREALRTILALPGLFYAGHSLANAQTSRSSSNSTLETAVKTNPSLSEKIYAVAQKIKNATICTTYESYVPPMHPSAFDYYERGQGILLKPLNSPNTYFASCAHVWDFDLSEHRGTEKTLAAVSRRGIQNPKKEDIVKRMKIAGYLVEPQNIVDINKRLEYSVLKVNDIMPMLGRFSTPLEIDLNKQITHAPGDKVFWLPQEQKGFPLVEANIIEVEGGKPSTRRSGQPDQEQSIITDIPISFESGKPVVSLYGNQPSLSGIISERIPDTLNGPFNRAVFTSANHVIDAIRRYEATH